MTSPEKVKEKLNQVGPGFCLAKWTQVTIHLGSGINHSCHHVKAHAIPLKELKDNPNVLHNTQFKKNTRHLMLQGERPSECDYCWRIEDNTENFSDRIYKSADDWSWPDFHKIRKANAQEDFYPRYVEISFSNVCNFKCGYCGPAFSSKWGDEINRHGPYNFKGLSWKYNQIDEYQKQIPERETNPYIEAFWKWFPTAVKHMHTFRITGGEPLMSKHTNKVLDHLLKNPQPNLEFAVNSNACPPGNKWKDFVKKIKTLEDKKCIKRFTLFVSAESMGEQAEYNRFGMDWDMFSKNVNYYLENTKAVCVFMSAFNILSFPTFFPFVKYVGNLKYKFKPRIWLSIPYVRNPGFLDAKIATKPLVEKYLYPALSYMKANKAVFDKKETQDLDRIINDLETRFKKPNEFGTIAQENRRMFIEWIVQYDKRRGTKFHKTFPELHEFWLECKKCMI